MTHEELVEHYSVGIRAANSSFTEEEVAEIAQQMAASSLESSDVEFLDTDDEVYETLPISPGDRITVKLTHAFVVNGQTQWSTAETEIAVLPDETSEEASERAQALALGTVFQAADNLVSIIDQRREAQKALLNKTQA